MIKIENNNDDKLKDIIHNKLRKNNMEKCNWLKNNESTDISISNIKQNNFIVFDENKLIGGAVGYIKYNWYFLDLLYINEEYRNKNIGTALLKEIEKMAKNKGLTGIRMSTWDFQAKGFYEKNGYKVFAEIENCPPGTINYDLKKVF